MALITDDRSDWLIARGLGISKDAVADIARHDISSAPTDDRFGLGFRVPSGVRKPLMQEPAVRTLRS
ncbi:hypothetical protein ACC755_24255, partial [Rhizobium ruizarguesonis]